MSEMVNAYALQELSLERRVRDDDGELVLNDYSEHTYEDAETILARYQPRSGLVRTATGDEVAAESTVLTTTEILLGDRIEGSDVRRVVPLVDFSGQVFAYKAFL